jgi:hypothetical protein
MPRRRPGQLREARHNETTGDGIGELWIADDASQSAAFTQNIRNACPLISNKRIIKPRAGAAYRRSRHER